MQRRHCRWRRVLAQFMHEIDLPHHERSGDGQRVPTIALLTYPHRSQPIDACCVEGLLLPVTFCVVRW